MTTFSSTIQHFWNKPFAYGEILRFGERLSVSVNPALADDRRVTLLESAGQVRVAVTPAIADRLRLSTRPDLTEAALRQALAEAAIALHGADHVFYYAESDRAGLVQEAEPAGVRQLTARDESAFAEFQGSASEQDLDDAYVELDHWAVFGAFEQGRLVAAASMYPWDDGPEAELIADTGVLSLPPFRGRGHARALVRAISRYACRRGYQPQYRCQIENKASVALAGSAGLSLYGKWEVVSPDADEQPAAASVIS